MGLTEVAVRKAPKPSARRAAPVPPEQAAESTRLLAALALAIAGAADQEDLVARVGRELTSDSGQQTPVRLWVFGQGGDLKLLARYPVRSRHRTREAEAVVEVALADGLRTIEASVLIPLRVEDSPIGVLVADCRSGRETDALDSLAPAIAARLSVIARSDVRLLPAVLGLGATASEIEAVMGVFATEAKRVLDHDRLSVYMLTHDGQAFERFAVATSAVVPGEAAVVPLEDVGLTYVLRTNRALVSADLATDERISGTEDQVVAAAGFHGLVSAPLRVRGTTIGLLNFVSRTPGFYSAADAPVAQQLADQVAIFLQNLRLEERTRLAIEQQAAQQERNRLAHEFHDTLAQSLAEMLDGLDVAGKRLRGVDAKASVQVNAVREQGQTLLFQLRRSLLNMRPAELERGSLEDAMRAALAVVEHDHDIETSFAVEGPTVDLSSEVQSAVFRIFQEGLTNARRHSGAASIAVTLGVGDGLTLSIEDDGSGFEQDSRRGFGLASMRERAEEIGGQLTLSSVVGRGTTVLLRVNAPKGLHRSTGSPRRRPEIEGATRVTRILLVDDHPLFRDALARLIERELDLRIVGQAGTGADALAAAKRLRPDLVLLDIELPDASGMEVQRRLARLKFAPLTLMLSSFAEDGHVLGAIQAGARGYVAKTIEGESLLESIRAVVRGALVFDAPSGADLSSGRQLGLTARELDVLALIASGMGNSEIAVKLCLAQKTVERIVATAVVKMEARNRSHAVARAVAMRLVEVPVGREGQASRRAR